MSVGTLSIHQNVYQQLITKRNSELGVKWYSMDPRPRPCFTMDLLADFKKFGQMISQSTDAGTGQQQEEKIQFAVLASRIPGVFSYGGDLSYFIQMIRGNSREDLSKYAKACVDAMYACWVGYHRDIVTIALVQGAAFGGGFEAALGNHVLIAEKDSRFCLPEVLFNLFPGMGAYPLLARRIGPGRAEKMILSGRVYTATELHEMGIVDVLAENGEGEKAVYAYINAHRRKMNAFQSILKVRQRCFPITYDEMIDVAEIWVDAALKLDQKELKLMERLVRTQDKIGAESAVSENLERGYA
ncbi:MAG: crotonase/enoyl-CoA hydratase family protein [Candidatus Deferrimicrobiaceae bacterium]